MISVVFIISRVASNNWYMVYSPMVHATKIQRLYMEQRMNVYDLDFRLYESMSLSVYTQQRHSLASVAPETSHPFVFVGSLTVYRKTLKLALYSRHSYTKTRLQWKLNKNREIAIKNGNSLILVNFHINFPRNNFAYPSGSCTYIWKRLWMWQA